MKEGKKNSKSKVKKNQNGREKKWLRVSLSGGTRIEVEIKIYTKYIDERGEKN